MQLEEKLVGARQAIAAEQAKSTRMNQETIANLQTLMLELEMIETKNSEVPTRGNVLFVEQQRFAID